MPRAAPVISTDFPARDVRGRAEGHRGLLGIRALDRRLLRGRCSLLSVAQQAGTAKGAASVTSTLENQPRRPRARGPSARWASRSSARASPAWAWRSRSSAGARPTSSSSSGPRTSAGPGGTTPIPARPATCSPTSTRSPSRRTPTGAAPTRSSRRSRPTCRRRRDRFDVRRHCVFGAEVTGARWDDAARRWLVSTAAGEFRARVLVSAAGALADPTYPDIPGLDSFAGTVMHSARWDAAHDLTGEQVAVIGTGASAIQVVPAIQPLVEQHRRLPAHARLGGAPHRPPGGAADAAALPARARLPEGDPRRPLPLPRVPRHRPGEAAALPQAGGQAGQGPPAAPGARPEAAQGADAGLHHRLQADPDQQRLLPRRGRAQRRAGHRRHRARSGRTRSSPRTASSGPRTRSCWPPAST